jgi:hypothetical protein
MLNVRFNPACKRELLYLRDGRVVRLVKVQGAQARVEHFWLCGECFRLHDFRFSSKEGVSLIARSWRPNDDADLGHQLLAPADICQEDAAAA